VHCARRPGILSPVKKGRRRSLAGGSAAALALTAAGTALPAPNPTVLQKEFFGEHVPKEEQYRTYYGKALDLQRIDYAIRSANQGLMRPMTDIARETVALDGHLSSTLQKRLNRLAALDWDLHPATGEDVDTEKAEFYSTFVRLQLEAIPRFRDAITKLAWAVFDARSGSEIAWRWHTSRWNVHGLNWIHPRRISFGPDRDLRVVDSSRESGGFRDIGFPLERLPYKFLTYAPQLFCDYPEREGLAPRCLYWSFFQRFGTRERMALLELFGRPWRIVKPLPGATTSVEGMQSAFETVKMLGYHNTARLPAGWDVDVIQPFTGAGQVSGEVIDHAQKVISKLILGNTGTTDAVSTGLGSSIGDAHVSEEDLIIWSDARRLAEVIEDQLTDAIIAVNFGPEETAHAPKFIFRTEPPMDRAAELARITGALGVGLDVSLEEAREKLGVREVRDGQPYLRRIQRPAAFGQLQPPPLPEVIYPIGEAPPAGELADAPDVGINIPGGGANGLPPAAPSPGATPLPALPAATGMSADDDEPDAVAALCDKMTELQIPACEHGRKNVCTWCGIERVRDVEMVNGEAVWKIEWRPIRAAKRSPADGERDATIAPVAP
jgi:phage gp29-like protein